MNVFFSAFAVYSVFCHNSIFMRAILSIKSTPKRVLILSSLIVLTMIFPFPALLIVYFFKYFFFDHPY